MDKHDGGVAMLVCGCGNWMHTEGVEELGTQDGERLSGGERPSGAVWPGGAAWMVRCECRRCDRHVGVVGPSSEVRGFVDRLMWTDDARHAVERLPWYAQGLVHEEVEGFARAQEERVITWDLFARARNGGTVSWDPAAEQRLEKIPAAIRAMARQELERTAMDRGDTRVTIALMEEVKARYFGLFGKPSSD